MKTGNSPISINKVNSMAEATPAIQMLNCSEGLYLRCTTFNPPTANGYPPILFVPGLASVFENFKGVVGHLSGFTTIHFLETREKSSSRIHTKKSFTVKDIAEDISMAAELLNLPKGKYILAGYSLGATASAEAFCGLLKRKPAMVVLAEPGGEFDFSKGEILAARLLWPLFNVLKPFIKYYLRVFRMNAREDREMYEITRRVIDSASPRKLASAVVGIAGYSIYPALKKIDVPVLLIGVSSDKMHGHDEPVRMAESIAECRYVDLVDNKRSHSTEAAVAILDFIGKN